VISVAKNPEPAAQSSGFEILIEKCSGLLTKIRGCAIFLRRRLSRDLERDEHLLTTPAARLPGKGSSTVMPSDLQVQMAR